MNYLHRFMEWLSGILPYFCNCGHWEEYRHVKSAETTSGSMATSCRICYYDLYPDRKTTWSAGNK